MEKGNERCGGRGRTQGTNRCSKTHDQTQATSSCRWARSVCTLPNDMRSRVAGSRGTPYQHANNTRGREDDFHKGFMGRTCATCTCWCSELIWTALFLSSSAPHWISQGADALREVGRLRHQHLHAQRARQPLCFKRQLSLCLPSFQMRGAEMTAPDEPPRQVRARTLRPKAAAGELRNAGCHVELGLFGAKKRA